MRYTYVQTQSLALHWVTVLQVVIDTEGHDLPVLRGMRRALERKQVRQIEFEYSRYGSWGNRGAQSTLEYALTWLKGHGYFCYWLLPAGGLLPASPPCWRGRAFEIRRWSNLRCAHEPPVIELLQQAARRQHRMRAHAVN